MDTVHINPPASRPIDPTAPRAPTAAAQDAGAAPAPRSTYRHGDLHRALLEAALDLAREGGPEAVVLREATRRAGVVPNAAYRHFENRQALLQAVRAAALAAVADAMAQELAALPPARAGKGGAVAHARAQVRAVGTGYLRFALAEPGLFRTAFALPVDVPDGADRSARSGLNPFEQLGAALDALVAAGALPATRRPGAEHVAWSAVHGLAMLVLDGPLRRLKRAQLDALGQRVLDMVEAGL